MVRIIDMPGNTDRFDFEPPACANAGLSVRPEVIQGNKSLIYRICFIITKGDMNWRFS